MNVITPSCLLQQADRADDAGDTASAEQLRQIAAEASEDTELGDRIVGRMSIAVVGATVCFLLSEPLAELLLCFGETVARWLA